MMDRQKIIAPLIIFTLAFLARSVYLYLDREHLEQTPVSECMRAARSIAEEGEFAHVFPDRTGPTAHLPPLYPFLLALIYKSCGVGSVTSLTLQRLLPLTAASLSAAVLPLIGRRAGFSNWVGIAAGVSMAFWPFNLALETTGRNEQAVNGLFLLLILWMFLGLSRRVDFSWKATISAGFVMGLSALLNPALTLTGGAMAVLGAMTERSDWRREVLALCIMGMTCVLVVAPWTYRNYLRFGRFIPIRSNLGLELWIGNHPGSDGTTYGATASPRKVFFKANHPFDSPSERDELKRLGEPEYMEQKLKKAIDWIDTNPTQFLKLTLRRLRLFWLPPPILWDDSGGELRSVCVCTMTVLGLCGLIALFLTGHADRWQFATALVVPSLPYLLTHFELRYRYPIWGILSLLTMFLFDQIMRTILDAQRITN
jgi:hypothetical protein